MRTVRDPDVVIASWLEEGPTELPDSTSRAIATAIEALPQRRLNRLPWRFSKMNRQFRLAIAAALIVAAALGGLYLLRPGGGLSGGPPTVSPSPGVSPTATRSEPLVGTVTLTPTECAFAPGPAPLIPGLLRVDIRNDSEHNGGFDLLRIREESTYDDLAAFVREEDARVRAGEPYLGAMALTTNEATWDLAPGETFSLIFDASQGTYGVLCSRIDPAAAGPGGIVFSFTLFGPLEVR
jgi:hypothetical protein